MHKRSPLLAVLASAVVAGGGFAVSAATATAQEVPPINIGNDACIAPWQWNGPGTIGLTDNTTTYEACNGEASGSSGEGINIGNNACILPWQWNGPFNAMNSGNTTTYSACNTSGGADDGGADDGGADDGGADDGGADDGGADDGGADDGGAGGGGDDVPDAPAPSPVPADLPVTG